MSDDDPFASIGGGTGTRQQAAAAPAPKTINDLFNDTPDDHHDDPFAQLEEEDNSVPRTAEDLSQYTPNANVWSDEQPTAAPAPADNEGGEDQPVQPETAVAGNDIAAPPDPEVQSETQVPGPAEPAAAADQRDFSDLLAEFDESGGLELETPQAQAPASDPIEVPAAVNRSSEADPGSSLQPTSLDAHEPAPPGKSPVIPPAPIDAPAGLFDDSPTDNTFDILVQSGSNDVEGDAGERTANDDNAEALTGPSADLSIPLQDSAPADEQRTKTDARAVNGAANADHSMQSLFTDDSDWLDDTSVEESMRRSESPKVQTRLARNKETGQGQTLGSPEDGNQALSFEVPQGWFDDDGAWHFYTEEEREQVRLTMLGEGSWDDEPQQDDAYNLPEPSPGLPRSPGRLSENAARRTPVPETNPYERTLGAPGAPGDPYAPPQTQPQRPSQLYQSTTAPAPGSTPYDPYQPQQSSQSSYVAPQSSASPYAPPQPGPAQASPYTPAPQSNPYAPSNVGSAQPYAPAPSGPYSSAAPQPYGVAPTPYAANAMAPSPAGPSIINKPPPIAPQRMPSTAYDPPMLKSQRKPARSASSMSLNPGGFTSPTFQSAPSMGAPPPPAPTAPPAGPPRRSKTPKIEPPPPIVEAPAPAPPMPGPSEASNGYARRAEDAPVMSSPPPPMPNQGRMTPQPAQQDMYGPSSSSMPPPPPPAPPAAVGPPKRPASSAQSRVPRTPSYAAFDPPLRPASTSRQSNRAASTAGSITSSPPTQRTSTFSPPPRPPSVSNYQPQSVSQAPSIHELSAADQSVNPPPPPPSHTSAAPAPPPGQALSAPQPMYEPPRAASRGSNRTRSPMFEAPPKFEAPPRLEPRPSSRQSAPRFSPQPPAAPPVQPAVDQEGYGTQTDESENLSLQEATRGATVETTDTYQPYQPTPDVALHTSNDYANGDQSQRYEPSSTAAENPQYEPPSQTADYQEQYGRTTTSDSSYQPTQPPIAPAAHDPYQPSYAPSNQASAPPADTPVPVPAPASSVYQPAAPPALVNDPYAPSAYAPSSYVPTAASEERNNAYGHRSATSTSSNYGSSPPPIAGLAPPSIAAQIDHTYTPQQVLEQRPVSEDPLGRATLAARNRPIAVFGFGGRLVTAFPGLAEDQAGQSGGSAEMEGRVPSYGYASGRGQVWIRSLDDISSSSALRASDTVFPGPLVLDPATPKGAAGEKKKREAILGYLEARADEIEKGLPYLKTSANQSRREEEGKLVLVRLLIAMIHGDGKFSGSPKVEEAVRAALVGTTDSSSTGPSVVSVTAPSPHSPVKNTTGYFPGQSAQSTKAKPGQLSHLSDLLQQGNKQEAVQYSVQNGLWAHALLISSSISPEAWRDVVAGFTQAELGAGVVGNSAMRASYTLFSGLTTASIDELINTANITGDAATDQWQQVISAVVFNGKPADQICIDDLAARLNAANLVNAAHACHLLSPSSPFSDNTSAAFDRLIGLTQNPRDDDALVFAEVAEYARNLVPVPKGQEPPIVGLPQLLPYKLQRAWRAAELGDVDQAQKYCTAIESASKAIKNGPSLLPFALMASMEDLSERLTGTPSANPANLLMPHRKNKSGVDKFGSWIEGRLTKFIAGEDDAVSSSHITITSPAKSKSGGKDSGPIGPFSHFSTISPAVSGQVTRATSTVDVPGLNGRASTSPALQQSTWGQSYDPNANGEQTPAVANSYEPYGAYNPYDPAQSSQPSWGQTGTDQPEPETPGRDGDVGDQPHAGGDGVGGMFNPMAHMHMGPSPEAARVNYTPQPVSTTDEEDEDEDDLGFGNAALSRNRTPKPADDASSVKEDKGKAQPQKAAAAEKQANGQVQPPAKPEQKGSWIGRWWVKKEGEGPGPVRAKLGEESSMVFDKDLKRWVVKGQKPEAAPPPLAPPPRAQTISPALAASKVSDLSRAATPPSAPSSLGPSSGAGMRPPPGPPGPPGGAPQAGAGAGAGAMPPPARSGLPRSTTVPVGGFTQISEGEIKRAKPPLSALTNSADGQPGPPLPPPSSLNSSTSPNASGSGSGPASTAGPGPGPGPGPRGGGGPPPPSGLTRSQTSSAGASLDDLLSRPPSKRPASAARKPMKSRYVDVFQPGQGGGGQ